MHYTPFECKVYQAIVKIPFGQARSYKWVARQINKPKTVRAVGAALRKNPYTQIIPCHRVVKSDGSLGGYSLGLRKKKEILGFEKSLLDSKLLPKLLRNGNINDDITYKSEFTPHHFLI